MSTLLDLLPVILFFVVFKAAGIYAATAVAIVAGVIQIGFMWFKNRKLDKMQIATLAIIIIFGGSTLVFHDEQFIQWKPTALYWLTALAFFLTPIFSKKTPVEFMLEKAATEGTQEVTRRQWTFLNLACITLFLSAGFLNLWVKSNFPLDTWVNFKLLSGLGLAIIFAGGIGLFLGIVLRNKRKDPA